MSMAGPPVTLLGEDECWSLLSSLSLCRFVTCLDGRPEVFPVNFVTQRPTVLFRTAEGTRLFGAATNPCVFRGRLPRHRTHLRVERHRQGPGKCVVGQRRNRRS